MMVIYNFSNKINYFWTDCPVDVYTSHYSSIKAKYLEKYTYAKEIDFIKYEYQFFLNDGDLQTNVAHTEIRGGDYLSLLNYKKYLTFDNRQFFSVLNTRKIEFLKTELNKLGYKAEIIDIGGKPFINMVESNISQEEDLNLIGLPKFNVQQRYELFKRLGYEGAIHTLDTDRQMSKYKIIAIIMGLNPDNAKRLFNHSYKVIKVKEEDALNEFLNNQGIRIK